MRRAAQNRLHVLQAAAGQAAQVSGCAPSVAPQVPRPALLLCALTARRAVRGAGRGRRACLALGGVAKAALAVGNAAVSTGHRGSGIGAVREGRAGIQAAAAAGIGEVERNHA